MDVNSGEAEAVQVGEGMLSTVIKRKRAECCLAMGPGRDYTARHRITLSVFDDWRSARFSGSISS